MIVVVDPWGTHRLEPGEVVSVRLAAWGAEEAVLMVAHHQDPVGTQPVAGVEVV